MFSSQLQEEYMLINIFDFLKYEILIKIKSNYKTDLSFIIYVIIILLFFIKKF
jgi:hypothetical protein